MTTTEIDQLNTYTWEMVDRDARQALDCSRTAREEAEKLGYRRGLASALRNSGECHWVLLDFVSALRDFFEALPLVRELDDTPAEANLLNSIGKIHFRLNDYPAALDYYTQSLHLRQQIGDRRGEAGSLNNIGLVYFDMGRHLDAHRYYSQGLVIHEEIGNKAGAAIALNNLGLVQEMLEDLPSALECHRRSLEIKQQLGNLSGVCVSLNNMGHVSRRMGEYTRALDYNRQSLELARQTGHRYDEAQAWINIGESQQALGDLEQAMLCCEQGLEILRGSGDAFTQVETLLDIGDNCARRGLTEQAVGYLNQALALSESLRSYDMISRVHKALSALYEAQNDLIRALGHYKHYHEAQARLFTEEFDHRKRILQIQAEIDRVRHEAEIHRLKHIELAKAYRDLQQADEQKTALLTTLQLQTQELERLTWEDNLTGVSNRRHLDQMVRLECERARRFDHDLTVAMIDIDDFKRINDRFSHPIGDAVLRRVAQILRNGCRLVDVVGRYGGEEFMLLLIETGLVNSLRQCERLRAAIQDEDWERLAPGLTVTVSIGVADNREAVEPDTMIALSDARLYHAKANGKNQVCGTD